MTFKPGFRSRLLVGDFALSTKLTTFENALTIDQHDVTVFKDENSKDFIPGTDSSALSCEGFLDADAQGVATDWTAETPVAFAVNGLALGSIVEMCAAIQAGYTPGSTVGGVASFSLSGNSTGPSSYGVSIHDLAAETVDANGTAVDGGAASSNGGFAQLHLTAMSGITQAIVTVEDSANGSSGWATIATFATATGTTAERVAIAGAIRRYTRTVVDVTGTGSVTFAVALARH